VTLLDLFPTLVQLVGGVPPQNTAGRSLIPLILEDSKDCVSRYVFSEGKGRSRSVRSSEYAYYLYTAYDEIHSGENAIQQWLFDARNDFRETKNILEEKPGIASALHERLLQEFGVWGDMPMPEVDDAVLKKRLNDLGYL
jgi:arylsulfatase A-like enzyme